MVKLLESNYEDHRPMWIVTYGADRGRLHTEIFYDERRLKHFLCSDKCVNFEVEYVIDETSKWRDYVESVKNNKDV